MAGRFRIVLIAIMATAGLGSVAAHAETPDADAFAVAAGTVTLTSCWVLDSCNGAGPLQAQPFAAGGGLCAAVSIEILSEAVAEAETPSCSFAMAGMWTNVTCGTGAITSGSLLMTEGQSDSYAFQQTVGTLVAGVGVVAAIGSGDGDGSMASAVAGVTVWAPRALQLPAGTSSTCSAGYIGSFVLASDA